VSTKTAADPQFSNLPAASHLDQDDVQAMLEIEQQLAPAAVNETPRATQPSQAPRAQTEIKKKADTTSMFRQP